MSRLTIIFSISLMFQSSLCCSENIKYETDLSIIAAKLSESQIVLSDSKKRKICSIDLNDMRISKIMEGTAWDIKIFKDEIVLLMGSGKDKIKVVSYDTNGTIKKNAFEHDLKNRLIPYPRIIDNERFIYQTGDTFFVKDLFSNHVQYKQVDSGFGNLSSFSSQNEKSIAFARSNTDMYSLALVKINQNSFEVKKFQLDTIYNFIFALPGFSVNVSNDKIYFGRCDNDLLKIFVMEINTDKFDIKQHKIFKNADAILDIRGNKILLKNKSSFLVEGL